MIHIKFVSGEETFKVRAFKTRIEDIFIVGRNRTETCKVGERVALAVHGEGMSHVDQGGATGTMLDVADNHYKLSGKLPASTDTTAQFALDCTAVGQFTVNRDWFRDTRVSGNAADAMVRTAATLLVTVAPADPVPHK